MNNSLQKQNVFFSDPFYYCLITLHSITILNHLIMIIIMIINNTIIIDYVAIHAFM